MSTLIITACVITMALNIYYAGMYSHPDEMINVYLKLFNNEIANISFIFLLSFIFCIYFIPKYKLVRESIFTGVFGTIGAIVAEWIVSKISYDVYFNIPGILLYICIIVGNISFFISTSKKMFDQSENSHLFVEIILSSLIYGYDAYWLARITIPNIIAINNLNKACLIMAAATTVIMGLYYIISHRFGLWIKWNISNYKKKVADKKVKKSKEKSNLENSINNCIYSDEKNNHDEKNNKAKNDIENIDETDQEKIEVDEIGVKEIYKEKIEVEAAESSLSEWEDEKVKKLLKEINSLIGLKGVKEDIIRQVDYIKATRKRELNNIFTKGSHVYHMVFLGEAGTGKTTVARLLGELYHAMGLLPKVNFVEVTRTELVSQYIGETAIKTKEQFMKAKGGVLFVDEAYSLFTDKNDSYGKEAINTLMKLMEDCRKDTMVIFAGYAKEMDEMLSANPGMKSRIPSENYITFENYSEDELLSILKKNIKDDKFELAKDVKDDDLKRIIRTASRSTSFHNARGVRELAGRIERTVDKRVAKTKKPILLKKDLVQIRLDDLKKLKEYEMSEKAIDIKDLLDRLDNMVGIEKVKSKVREIISSKRVMLEMKKRGLDTAYDNSSMHMVFKGNPGTGKTTVARLIAKIYNQAGILPKDTLIEVDRKDLIAEYVGQTAIKTQEVIEKAMGGILFIDEAYSLNDGNSNGFGDEAIATLIKAMEDYRDRFMVIFAGYSNEMDDFIKRNPGMSSRIPYENILEFDDYSIDELTEIFFKDINDRKLIVDKSLKDDIAKIIEIRSKDTIKFGNARGVRNIIDDLVAKKNCRISDKITTLSDKELITITKEDVLKVGKEA